MSSSDKPSGKTKTPAYWAALVSAFCSVVRVVVDLIQ